MFSAFRSDRMSVLLKLQHSIVESIAVACVRIPVLAYGSLQCLIGDAESRIENDVPSLTWLVVSLIKPRLATRRTAVHLPLREAYARG